MQLKIAIGTIAFMLAMMVFGYAALREPARLGRFINAELGRSIEAGGNIFANNCTTCHGIDGTAQECYDSSGNQIACQGLPLNYNALLCGDKSQRMTDMGWQGTKRNYVLSVVSVGRGAIMPAWAEQFGGPLRPDQVENVTNFVLNWESETLCAAPVVTYDWPETAEEFLARTDEVQPGDATRGAELYSVTYGCQACHGSLDGAAPAAIGPSLVNIETDGATRVEGMDALQYVYHSILFPSDHIAPECPTGPCAGPPSAMPANFGARMGEAPQDMADILAALLGE
ncbi:c-type cytochrome [Promineifilum sp.]|uniref:c-type cytochrome n=1 Tax=Promineifilum sp. TaxID=2664178 RepID=UPI0035B24BD4